VGKLWLVFFTLFGLGFHPFFLWSPFIFPPGGIKAVKIAGERKFGKIGGGHTWEGEAL